MPCIKTGADVWFNVYGMAVHGDLFRVDDVYILNCSDAIENCVVSRDINEVKVSLVVLTDRNWETIGSRVIAVPMCGCTAFTYEAKPLLRTFKE